MLEDHPVLRTLTFKLNTYQPIRETQCCSCHHGQLPSHPAAAARARRQQLASLPRLLSAAAKLHNASACACMARLLDACSGPPEDVMRWWQKAAKAGDVEAALQLGTALYEDRGCCLTDSDGSASWLSRGVKGLLRMDSLSEVRPVDLQGACNAAAWGQAVPPPSGPACGDVAAAGEPAGPAEPAPAPLTVCLPAPSRQLTPSQRAQVVAAWRSLLAKAALMLGFHYFDGEGVKADKPLAVRLFKLAGCNGSREAERVLGWIFNTGQFG